MFFSSKQRTKPLLKTVVVYPILMLSVLFFSCSNSSGRDAALPKMPHTDTLKIRAENIFRIYVSKITAANGSDSVLLLLDRSSSLLYKVDTANHILGVDTLPRTVMESLKAFTYHNGAYYVMYENLLKRFPADRFREKPKEYTFNHSDVNVYYSATSELEIDRDQGFLIYGAPKFTNLIDAAGRARFFGSKVIHKGVIQEETTLIQTKPQTGITFPERYKFFYYSDMSPVYCSFGDSIAYTVKYCDSLAIVHGGKKEYFKIPKQFSVAAEPASEACVQNRTESDAYYATHSSNIKLLKYKQKILLFQGIKVDQYYDEQSGMLNDPLSRKKRIVVFDMVKKQFEPTSYELPANCVPAKSCIFNDKLYIFFTDETRREISVLPTTL